MYEKASPGDDAVSSGHTSVNVDEPFDPLDNEYPPPPAGALPPNAQTNPQSKSSTNTKAPKTAADSDDEYDPLSSQYGPLPDAVVAEQASRAKARRESFNQLANLVRVESYRSAGLVFDDAISDDDDDKTPDEYDPLSSEYGPAPPGTIPKKERKKAAAREKKNGADDDAFDPLSSEYGPLPDAVVAEQSERARARRESFSQLANLVRTESYRSAGRVFTEDPEDDADDDDLSPLACNYSPLEPIRTNISTSGSLNVYCDVEDGSPPRPSTTVNQEIDPRCNECPPLNIVIFIVGSRGDVQPYLALALELIKTRGHRVRIATHAPFKQLIEDTAQRLAREKDAHGAKLSSKLEFFDIGGDPHELMAYMVRNPGLIPGVSAIANGDIRSKRQMVKVMLMGCYQACFAPNETTGRLFAADCIIANPPSFAHLHCAEALGIPLVLSFTMPWTPTTDFPHPLVSAKISRIDDKVNNYSSYILASALTWQGLGDLINTFRYAILGLRPLQPAAGPFVLDRLKIPVTYAWSESLLPKPKDWRSNIDVVGFYSMPATDDANVKVDPAIRKFLADGEAPVYIGFGSIVVNDPEALTKTILAAVEECGVRAIVSAGWADIGGPQTSSSDILIVKGDIPHDWLFADGRVAVVCHHGGAGTTAAGLQQGVPTIIVPFFGDQRFWGLAVANSGAGPDPIAYSDLTTERLVEAIRFALLPSTREAARAVGQRIREENGSQRGVKSFHRNLPLLNMRCHIDENRAALWWSDKYSMRICGAAAAVLVEEGHLSWNDLRPHRSIGYEASRHYTDPFSAFGQQFLNVSAQAVHGTAQLLYAPGRGLTNLFVGLPKASMGAVGAVYEGLGNIPGMMGSPVRMQGNVSSFSTGMLEGVKGLGYGIWDGVTGLVTEPYSGAKEDGVGGLLSGMAKSWVNVLARPASGALGLVVHPTTGAIRGARTRLSRTGIIEADLVLAIPRETQSVAEARALSQIERQAILDTWRKLTIDELVESRKQEQEKRQADEQARLLKIDISSWPLSDTVVEQICTFGRSSFVAELATAAEEGLDHINARATTDGKATPARDAVGTHGQGEAQPETPTRDVHAAHEETVRSHSRSRSDGADDAPPAFRMSVQGTSTPSSLNSSRFDTSASASMTDLALAGTDRWNWSRPSSRASMASFSARRWVEGDGNSNSEFEFVYDRDTRSSNRDTGPATLQGAWPGNAATIGAHLLQGIRMVDAELARKRKENRDTAMLLAQEQALEEMRREAEGI